MQIIKKKISEITPYWRNPRINDNTIEVVKKSIGKYGYNVPIIIDEQGVIIAGHVRYKALKELGVEAADCVVFNGTEDQAREYRIVDNKTSELSEWDEDALIKELRDLNAEGLQDFFKDNLDGLLSESIGFDNEDVDDDDILRAEKKVDDRFDNKEAKFVRVICPYCKREFEIKKEDIIKGK